MLVLACATLYAATVWYHPENNVTTEFWPAVTIIARSDAFWGPTAVTEKSMQDMKSATIRKTTIHMERRVVHRVAYFHQSAVTVLFKTHGENNVIAVPKEITVNMEDVLLSVKEHLDAETAKFNVTRARLVMMG